MANFYLKAIRVSGRSERAFTEQTLGAQTLIADFEVLEVLAEPFELSFGVQMMLNFSGTLLLVNAVILNASNIQTTLENFEVGSVLVLSNSFANENAKLVSTIIKNRHVLGVTLNQLEVQVLSASSNFSAGLDIPI